MKILENKYGPFSGRLWGLFLNFVANAVAIHGAIKFMIHGQSPIEMVVGIGITIAVCMVLAVPDSLE